MIMVFNPLSSALLNKQERIAHKYLKGAASVLTVSNSGLWLKEKMGEGNIIIHAKSIYNKEMKLFDVSFFRLDYNNNFINRIDAKTATLKPGFWLLDSAFILSTSKFAEFHNNYEIPTNLAITKLQDSFASPETISFWEMPSFINTLKAAGFSAIRHSLYYYSLLIQPFFICSMVFIAASFSLHLPRHGKSNLYIVSGIFVGFVIYFFAYLVFALGLSGNIPVFLATIAPVAISMLIGISMLLHLEDG
jgi:lipopolysaccharide export system permease protein